MYGQAKVNIGNKAQRFDLLSKRGVVRRKV